MQRSEAYVGQKVVFGRRRGEQTLGEITKINLKTAGVQTLEDRGRQRRSGAGRTWKVPFSLMRTALDHEVARLPDEPRVGERPEVADVPLEFNPFQPFEDQCILEAIHAVYGELSPENLTCDGELSPTRVRQRRAVLERKLKGLQSALGRQVSEIAVWRWVEAKREHQQRNSPVAEAPVSLEEVQG